ncbi:MAG: tRNA (adenosine(37)-N6)-threonylcarbamoyltransferase complex dimerization subunit type 1 TsaB [Gammaproteobacteria bacterium]|jgi:tRNA threonylcarbamoyladenosine biosynthesis protein TsaB
MPRLLAIETATEACSVALLLGEEVQERFEVAPRRHAALLLPFADALLADAGLALRELDAIAFGRGPGSFTGLRIAAGTAQGMAFGADLPVVPVSTLAALAQGTVREVGAQQVLAALDARMQEVYWGAYRRAGDGLVEPLEDDCVSAPSRVPVPVGGPWHGAGSGWASYGETLARRCDLPAERIHARRLPHAADTARLAAALFERASVVPAQAAAPVYLRDRVADKPGSELS